MASRTLTKSQIKLIEEDCAKRLSALAADLKLKYDFSEATARKKSVGIKGFIAHRLIAKNGSAKIGGEQRKGNLKIDRYISYRVGNEAAALSAVLIPPDASMQIRWQVLGPLRLAPELIPAVSLRPYAPDSISKFYNGAAEFADFNSAATLFESLIAHLADPVTESDTP